MSRKLSAASGFSLGYGFPSYTAGSGVGYGFGSTTSGYGDGCVNGSGNGQHGCGERSMQRLGYADDYCVWVDPVFGYATVGCTTLSLNEWRKRWSDLAGEHDVYIDANEVADLFLAVEQTMKEMTCPV